MRLDLTGAKGVQQGKPIPTDENVGHGVGAILLALTSTGE